MGAVVAPCDILEKGQCPELMDEWQPRLAEMETVGFKTVFCHIRKHHLGEMWRSLLLGSLA